MPGVAALTGLSGDITVDDFEIDEQGDTARVTAPGAPQPLELVKADEQWWIAVPIDPGFQGVLATMTDAIADALNRAVDEIVAEIDSGTITSLQAVTEAMNQKMLSAMSGQRPPGGG